MPYEMSYERLWCKIQISLHYIYFVDCQSNGIDRKKTLDIFKQSILFFFKDYPLYKRYKLE